MNTNNPFLPVKNEDFATKANAIDIVALYGNSVKYSGYGIEKAYERRTKVITQLANDEQITQHESVVLEALKKLNKATDWTGHHQDNIDNTMAMVFHLIDGGK